MFKFLFEQLTGEFYNSLVKKVTWQKYVYKERKSTGKSIGSIEKPSIPNPNKAPELKLRNSYTRINTIHSRQKKKKKKKVLTNYKRKQINKNNKDCLLKKERRFKQY